MSRIEDSQTSREVSVQTLFIGGIIIAASLSWIFWDFLQRQFRFAIEKQADWGHTLIIPFIAGYFVWLCKDRLLEAPFRRAWFGLAIMLFGLAEYMVCALGPTAWHHHNLMGFGVSCTLLGLVLFIFGWRAMRYLWFPLLYLFVFSQTISDRFMELITFKLQDIAAVGSYHGLSILGLDVSRSGNTLEILYNNVSYPLNIAEACSGMRMLMAFLALGVAMAYTGLPYLWQRITLVFLAFPTAVFVNILRVMTLGLLSIADSGFAAGDFHTFVGTLWLIPAFMIYLGIVWILKNVIIEDDAIDEEFEVQNRIFYNGSIAKGFTVAVLLLATTAVGLQIAVGQLNVYLHKEAVFPRKDFSIIPTKINGWSKIGEDLRYDAAGVEALGTELYLSRNYSNRELNVPFVQLHLAYYTGQVDAVPHVPDRCMVAGGFIPLTAEPINISLEIDEDAWLLDESHGINNIPYPIVFDENTITGEQETIRLPIGEFELRTSEFTHPNLGDDHVFAGYFFIANGKTTAYPERIRLLAFDPSQKQAYYCKVQFTMRGGQGFSIEKFNQAISAFTLDLLPEIMKCLPDWVEVLDEQNQDISTQ